MPIFDPDFALGDLVGAGLPVLNGDDSATTGFEQGFRVDAALAFPQEIQNRLSEQLDSIEQQTGKRLFRPNVGQIGNYARRLAGLEETAGNTVNESTAFILSHPNLLHQGGTPTVADVPLLPEDAARQIEELNTFLKDNGYQSFEDIILEVGEMQSEVEGRSERVSGFYNSLRYYAGMLEGSLTTRDPITLTTAAAGGFQRGVVARILTEIAINTGVEAINQYGFVKPNREAAGLPEGEYLQNTLLAGAFAGGITGGAHLAGKFLDAGGTRISRAIFDDRQLDFGDTQLRQMLNELPQTPKVRAGTAMLDELNVLERASPYGASPPALRRFSAEIAEVEMKILGRTDLGSLRTSTAIGRVLPELPFRDLEQLADFQILRVEAPVAFGRLEAAAVRVTELEEISQAASRQLDDLTPGEAFRAVDEDTGNLLKSLEEDLKKPGLTTRERVSIQRRMDQITETVGPGVFAKQINDQGIAPTRALKATRSKLRAARKEYRRAFAEVDAERAARKAVLQARGVIPRDGATDLLGYSIANRTMIPQRITREVMEAQTASIERAAAEGFSERVVLEMADDGTVDVGGIRISAAFEFDDEFGKTVTVGQTLEDIAEADKLDQAIKAFMI